MENGTEIKQPLTATSRYGSNFFASTLFSRPERSERCVAKNFYLSGRKNFRLDRHSRLAAER
ncbi:hypothetical protein SAMN05444377_1285 [Flavobacterium fontis]|uniref:Uncharacterized protein n=1 Tax=Flavobacterium fontis TaxID=1124188 RepID=A0A1M5F3B8_9FLAO|nr:hypothetical protein SAMN05444377_1285 [Flavobacterium fontis]